MDESLQQALRDFLQDTQRRDAALLSSGYQGSAYLYQSESTRLVIKKAAGGFFTGWFNRRVLRREARIYQLINQVSGVPHSPGMLDDTYLLLEFIDGESLKEARKVLKDSELFYSRLRQVIADFHAVGVAHGDLKRKDNVLVTAAEQPFIIDFGTAVYRKGGLWDRLAFHLIRRLDKNAWIKAKYDRNYDSIAAADLAWYRPSIVEIVFGAILKFWRIITFRQARKKQARKKQD
jgi:predicted Ser/Thr protein kinase